MKVLVIVTLAAAAVGQQFQQQRQYDTAVRLATPGYFTQGGSFTSASFQNANGRLQGDSFQNSFQTATSDANTFRQSGLFQNSNQLQSNAGTNRNQFQTGSFQQNSFDSNAFQQNSSPFQQNSFFQSGSSQFGSDNRFQTNSDQINSGSRFQSANQQDNSFQTFDNQKNSASTFSTFNNQQNLGGQFQQRSSSGFPSGFNQQDSNNQFQSSFNNQDSNNRFQSTNNQNSNNRFQSTFNQNSNNQFQSSFDNQNSNNRFQSTFNNQDSNRFSQNSQTTSFLRSSSDSVSGVFEPLNLPSGASALLGGITSAFSCLDRPYGYYADQDNSCRVFHVCNPTLFSNGAVETYQYSFMCGEGSVFDQKELACVAESSAIPCQESSNYFYTNEQFGRPEDKSF
ncbi:probable ATP-dependent RNA helicase ddx42 [Penaeus vannamei]|uniref:probable ATP-dependent RNA helicase ddx42 n=1 Tax=Penaeus vannamei TaxID=6689 RepID=UPI00387F71F2